MIKTTMAKNKKKKSNNQKGNIDESALKRDETRQKIKRVLEARAEKIEKAAEEIAPDFDYEKESKELAFEERGEAILESKGPLPPAEVSTSKYPKKRREFKTRLGRLLFKDRHSITIGITALMLVGVIIWVGVYWKPLEKAESVLAYLRNGSNEQSDVIETRVEEKTEKVKAESKVVLDPSLSSGVQQIQEGKNGKAVYTYTTTYVNGTGINTEKKLKEWISKPKDRELRLGTSATGQKGTYRITRTFTANCTAYTSRPGAGGALGLGVHYGTCAVDPRFVSYRSEMWIEGYGYAFANDCGGAVKGNIVDLWMGSTSACIGWGRRNCTAYVLEPVG
ncbi:MAG: G5 domain-containing protein [Clostridiales bacterium]|nr:G5 domain-containing protein [Candidatus Crickella caballi]